MRNTFVNTLVESAASDPTICLVVGDLGYSVVEPFCDNYGARFLNAGVAEQNMTGVAAGMAMTGLKVFTYSIANFPTLRCLEQIRNDVCYHGADVTVVAVGGGLGYGNLGYSHHAVQDIACMRTLPGMTLLLPGSPAEVVAVTRWKLEHPGPAYLRLGKGGEPNVGDDHVVISEPGLRPVAPGREVAAIAVGGALGWAGPWAISRGHALYSIPVWVDCEDARKTVIDCVTTHRRTVVIEEHLPGGGIGSLVREVLEPQPNLQGRVRCLALQPSACGQVGSASYLRERGNLTETAYSLAAQ
jgi:transketolase